MRWGHACIVLQPFGCLFSRSVIGDAGQLLFGVDPFSMTGRYAEVRACFHEVAALERQIRQEEERILKEVDEEALWVEQG